MMNGPKKRSGSILCAAFLVACAPSPVPTDNLPADSCGGCAIGTACDDASRECRRDATSFVITRDGEQLRTRVLLPEVVPAGGVTAILERTPYQFPDWGDWLGDWGRGFAARGYAFVIQDTRGRFGSTGEDLAPFVHEIDDGRDTTEWIAAQVWSNARVVAVGGSQSGFNALAAAIDNPQVVAVVADDAPIDGSYELSNGTVRLGYLFWRYLLDHGDAVSDELYIRATNTLALGTLDELVLDREDPYWRAVLANEIPRGAIYDAESLAPHLQKICAPVLSIYSPDTRWRDPIELWRGLNERGCGGHPRRAQLIVTADPHVHHLRRTGDRATPVSEMIAGFIDAAAQGIAPAADAPVYVSLGELSEPEPFTAWPPEGGTARTYWLGNFGADPQNGVLKSAQPGGTPADTLDVDPAAMDPCSADYPHAAYWTEPLDEELKVAGVVHLSLAMTTSRPDADVFAELYEYSPGAGATKVGSTGGVRLRYRDGYSEPRPATPGETIRVEVELPPLSHSFARGNSIGLLISAGACGFAENPHTGASLLDQAETATASMSYLHSADWTSTLTIPIR